MHAELGQSASAHYLGKRRRKRREHHVRPSHTQRKPQRNAHKGEHERLVAHHRANLPATRANGSQKPELTRALRHRNSERVVDKRGGRRHDDNRQYGDHLAQRVPNRTVAADAGIAQQRIVQAYLVLGRIEDAAGELFYLLDGRKPARCEVDGFRRRFAQFSQRGFHLVVGESKAYGAKPGGGKRVVSLVKPYNRVGLGKPRVHELLVKRAAIGFRIKVAVTNIKVCGHFAHTCARRACVRTRARSCARARASCVRRCFT